MIKQFELHRVVDAFLMHVFVYNYNCTSKDTKEKNLQFNKQAFANLQFFKGSAFHFHESTTSAESLKQQDL